MKRLKKLTSILLIAFALVLIVPVSLPITEGVMNVEAATVKINKTKDTLNVGETLSLKILGTKSKIIWSSSNKSVATVSSKGKVIAKKKGFVNITGKVGKKKYSCKLTIKEIEVTSITVNNSELTLRVGEYTTLYASVLPINATNKTVTWFSNDVSVATVDSTGKVIAYKVGTVAITASINDKKTTTIITIAPSKRQLIIEENSRHTNAINTINSQYNSIINSAKNKITEIKNQNTLYWGSYNDYSKEVSDLTNDISTYQRQIAALSLSTDRRDIASRLQIEQRLADTQEELSILQARWGATTQVQALEEEIIRLGQEQKTKINEENLLYQTNLNLINNG